MQCSDSVHGMSSPMALKAELPCPDHVDRNTLRTSDHQEPFLHIAVDILKIIGKRGGYWFVILKRLEDHLVWHFAAKLPNNVPSNKLSLARALLKPWI